LRWVPLLGVLGVATGAIAIGTTATSTSTTIIISTETIISTATSAARGKVIGSTIRNTAETRLMVTGEQRTSLEVKVLAVRVELVIVPEAELVRDPVAAERERDRALVELERGPVAVRELELGPVVARELERGPVAAELEQVLAQVVEPEQPVAQLVVALRTKSVTAAHRPDLVPLLEAEEDLAAAVAETTREPAATEAVTAWEVAE
jgi:hypothetical protein